MPIYFAQQTYIGHNNYMLQFSQLSIMQSTLDSWNSTLYFIMHLIMWEL